jgi:hypothetical protein
MKKIFQISFFALAFSALSFGLWQCTTKDELTKDLQIIVKNDLIRIPLSLRILDLNPAVGATSFAPPKVEIEITGPDADKIYTPGVEKVSAIGSVSGGLLDIALKKALVPTAANPIKFSLTLRAAGYLTTVRSFQIVDTSFQMQEIGMINLSSPPQGVAVINTTVDVGANGLAQDVAIKGDSVKVSIPKGTIFKTATGEVVTGAVSVQLVQFSPTSFSALEGFPGGFSPNNVKDKTGKDLGGGSFQTLGFLALDMKAGTKEVKNFENGELTISMNVSNTLKNSSNNNTAIKPGETVPLWSLDVKTGEWQQEEVVTMGGSAAQPVATWKQKHLSYWNLDYFWNFCVVGKTLVFPTNLPSNYYYVEFVDNITGFVYKRSYHYITAGISETLLFAPNISNPVRLRISNAAYGYLAGSNNNPQSGIFAYNTNSFVMCGSGTVNLVLNPAPQTNLAPTITVQVRGRCPQNPNLLVGPTAVLWFKPAGSSPLNWRCMGSVVNGYFQTSLLERGKEYDFMAFNGRTNQVILNSDIPTEFRKIPTQSTTNYTYLLPPIDLPNYVCSLF